MMAPQSIWSQWNSGFPVWAMAVALLLCFWMVGALAPAQAAGTPSHVSDLKRDSVRCFSNPSLKAAKNPVTRSDFAFPARVKKTKPKFVNVTTKAGKSCWLYQARVTTISARSGRSRGMRIQRCDNKNKRNNSGLGHGAADC